MSEKLFSGLQDMVEGFNQAQAEGKKFTAVDALLAVGEQVAPEDDNTLVLRWMKGLDEQGKSLRDGLNELGVVVLEGEHFHKRMVLMVAPVLRARAEETARGDAKDEGREGLTERDISMLYFYRDIDPDVQRIISLVQANPGYFASGKRLGESCVKIAADKLEALIEGHDS